MPATKTRTFTGSKKPAAALVKPKVQAPKAASAPITTLQQGREEEANEPNPQPVRPLAGGQPKTPEDFVVGDNYSIANYSVIDGQHPERNWVDEKGNRLWVSKWYPTQQAIIDYPDDQAEFEVKTALFKKLGVAYVGVLPGQPLKAQEARDMLKAQGAKIL